MDKKVVYGLMESNGLEICGQPKWTFDKNTCNTYELFVERMRLENGEMGSAQPALEMIEQDEELTVAFSDWLLEKAMRSAVELSAETSSHVTLSLNLLPLYANRVTFVERVLELLQSTGLTPPKLHFEVSEAQRLTERGIQNLNLLHDEYGIGLLLANFGTGYANIDLLREVHFDGLELDRSFAVNVPDQDQACRVVVGIVHLAHTLDLFVCAKGIETQEQFEFFEELNCAKGQGYLIGKPMNMEELRQYIDKYARKHGQP